MKTIRHMSTLASLCLIGGLLLPINAHAGLFGPNNFSECVLAYMPGAANDIVAYEVLKRCGKEFSATNPVEKKTGILAAFDSGSECTQKKAKDTPSPLAARAIQGHCYAIYEPANPYDDPNLGK